MNEDQLKKLPQWAQREVGYLKREIDDLKEIISQLKGDVKDPDLWLLPPGAYHKSDCIGIERFTRVKAHIRDKNGKDCKRRYVEFYRDNDRGLLLIMTQGGDMSVRPRCGNVLEIDVI